VLEGICLLREKVTRSAAGSTRAS